MTDAQARMILHDLEHQGASSLSMEQIYAIRRAQGALDDISEAKRLLKLAVEDFAESLGAMYTCTYCKYHHSKRETCAERETPYCKGICKWRYADVALKLIGEDGDTDGIAIQETEV